MTGSLRRDSKVAKICGSAAASLPTVGWRINGE